MKKAATEKGLFFPGKEEKTMLLPESRFMG